MDGTHEVVSVPRSLLATLELATHEAGRRRTVDSVQPDNDDANVDAERGREWQRAAKLARALLGEDRS